MTSSIMPGTLLGARYRLAEVLDEVDGARFWRATDQILERSVSAWVLPEDDLRVGAVMDAARRSATVSDPRLLRVLDADTVDGLCWVINEWGAGQSLDVMIGGKRVLTPDRAAWLVREVSAAIAVAHAHGVPHGRLAPENVMVTEAGTVRLIGFAVDAAIQRDRLRNGNFPGLSPAEADLCDLAGLLYAGLVSCWPGASGSHVPPAPRDASGPLRPRQVRAGVPRALDAICERVLNRERPDRTAHQISAVLAEYIGELASADPAAVGLSLPEIDSSLDDLAAITGGDQLTGRAAVDRIVPADPDSTSTALVPPQSPDSPVPVPVMATQPGASEAPDCTDSTDDTVLVPGGAVVEDEFTGEMEWSEVDALDDTESAPPDFASPGSGGPDPEDAAARDPDWHQPDRTARVPAPAFEPLPEKPLFAPEGTRRTPRGTAPTSATSDWGTEVAASRNAQGLPPLEDDPFPWSAPAATRRAAWPMGEDDPDGVPDDWEERTRRPWLRLPLVVAVLAVMAVAVALFLTVGNRPGTTGKGGATSPSATPTTSAAPRGQALEIAAAKDLDPYGVPSEENPDQVGNAVDGDPATGWQTLTYRRRPDLGGLKPGVGLLVDLGSIQRVGAVKITLVGSPTDLTVYAAPTAATQPSGIEGLTKVATRPGAGAGVALRLPQPVRTRYVVVWLTKLPPAGRGFRGEISEIAVTS